MSIAPLPVGTALRPDGRDFRYEVEELLGTGGFGHTYLARDKNLNRLVAVKELAFAPYCYRDTRRFTVVVHGGREERFDRLKVKFIQEAQKVAAIQESSDHPNIIRVHDVWEERGTAYYSMDYIRSQDTFGEVRMLGDDDTVRWEVIEAHARQLLSGINAVHSNGMFHGDLKPDNVLVAENGQIKILDFGTAKREEDLSNPVTSLAYSLGYAPVELMNPSRIREIGPWTDIYSIGMILIGATLGHEGENGTPVDPAVRKQSLKGDPYHSIASRLVAVGVPSIWANAIERMTEVEPKNRFQSVTDILSAITDSPRMRPRSESNAGASSAPPINAPVVRDDTVIMQPNGGLDADVGVALPPDDSHGFTEGEHSKGRAVPLMIGVLLTIVGGLALALFQPWDTAEPTPPPPVPQPDGFSEIDGYGPDGAELEACAEIECPRGVCSNGSCVPEGYYFVEGGQLSMGRADGGALFDATDERSSTIDIASFAIAEHEVTNREWRELLGSNPSYFSDCEDCPVESVNWYEALAYLNRRSTEDALDECYVLGNCTGTIGEGCEGRGACDGSFTCSNVRLQQGCLGYRLPTESEWEYVARLVDGQVAAPCDGSRCAPRGAWYAENSGQETHPVGTAGPTDRPVADLFGNVSEWTWDSYEEVYSAAAATTVRDHDSPVSRRGGGFTDGAEHLRATNRMYNLRSARSGHTGFRAVTTTQFEPNAASEGSE